MRIGRPNTGVTVRAGYDANGAGCDIPWTLSDKVAMLGVRTETGVVKLLEMMCRDDGRIICLERHGILVGADGESVHLEPHRPSVLIAGSLRIGKSIPKVVPSSSSSNRNSLAPAARRRCHKRVCDNQSPRAAIVRSK